MTVENNSPVSGPIITDGIAVEFPFSFKIVSLAHMVLRITDANGQNARDVNSGFTIDPQYIGSDTGGYVRYTEGGAPLPANLKVYPYRSVPYEQPNRIGNQGRFFPETHENTFDLLVMQIQQVNEKMSRSLVVDIGQTPPDIQSIYDAAVNAGLSAVEAAEQAQNAQDEADRAVLAASSIPYPPGTKKILVSNAGGDGYSAVNPEDARVLLAVQVEFDTMAQALAFMPITAPDTIMLRNYRLGDSAQALYKKVVAQPAHPGKFNITTIGGSVVWYELAMVEVSPQMFGAYANSTAINAGTDDTTAIESWKSYLSAKAYTVGKVSGKYRYAPAAATTWDVSARQDGYSILGRSKNGDGFYLDAGTRVRIIGANSFYHRFEHLHFIGSYDGPLVTIGKEDKSDAFNGSDFLLTVNNISTGPLAEVMRLNNVYQSRFYCTLNGSGTGRPGAPGSPGSGKGLVIRQGSFNHFNLAIGNCNTGLYLTDGAIFANFFVSMDIEEVDTVLKIDGASVSRNTFVSGQFLGRVVIDATAGNYTFFGVACNLVTYSGGPVAANLIGVEIETRAPRNFPATPAMPATGVFWSNDTGSKLVVKIKGGTYSKVRVRSADGGILDYGAPVSAGAEADFILHPKWAIEITYTAAPSWYHGPA